MPTRQAEPFKYRVSPQSDQINGFALTRSLDRLSILFTFKMAAYWSRDTVSGKEPESGTVVSIILSLVSTAALAVCLCKYEIGESKD